MAFALTVVYVAYALLSPASFFPELTAYRVELWLSTVAVIASIPSLRGVSLLRLPQSYLLFGLAAAAAVSMVANHWLGGALVALGRLMPSIVAFFLIVINVRSVRRIRVLAVVLAMIAIFYAVEGVVAFRAHDTISEFLVHERNEDTHDDVLRVRGLGVLNDPNDLAQFLLTVVPLVWLFWRKRGWLRNTVLVLIPTTVLMTGLALTRSRGGMVALLIVLIVALRPKLGATGSVIITAVVAILLLVVNFNGNRSMSVEAVEGRLHAWREGIEYLKSAPVFGIGLGEFGEHYEITAHNSFLLCASELGMFGYFFWMGLLVFSFSDVNRILRTYSPTAATSGHEDTGRTSRLDSSRLQLAQHRRADTQQSTATEQCARVIRLSIIGFMAAAWFLSRAYVITLFMYLGLAAALGTLSAVYTPSQAFTRSPAGSRTRLLFATVVLQVLSIFVIYMQVKIVRP